VVGRIDIPLVPLQVAALVAELRGEAACFRGEEELVIWDERGLTGTHVGENQSAEFYTRIGTVADALVEGAPRTATSSTRAAGCQ
jgi:hypothetical protein